MRSPVSSRPTLLLLARAAAAASLALSRRVRCSTVVSAACSPDLSPCCATAHHKTGGYTFDEGLFQLKKKQLKQLATL
jgi:hypothetical protein